MSGFFRFFFHGLLLWGSGMPPMEIPWKKRKDSMVGLIGMRLDTKPKSVAPENDQHFFWGPKKDQRPVNHGLLGSVDSQVFFFWYPEMVGF